MIVLDTHALLWWALDPDQLSSTAQALCSQTSIWLRTVALEWSHRDPADRVIVATALEKGVPLLSKDEALHAFSGVRCVW